MCNLKEAEKLLDSFQRCLPRRNIIDVLAAAHDLPVIIWRFYHVWPLRALAGGAAYCLSYVAVAFLSMKQ